MNVDDLGNFGCIVHVTTKQALAGIFRVGLLPGGSVANDARAETKLGYTFLMILGVKSVDKLDNLGMMSRLSLTECGWQSTAVYFFQAIGFY